MRVKSLYTRKLRVVISSEVRKLAENTARETMPSIGGGRVVDFGIEDPPPNI